MSQKPIVLFHLSNASPSVLLKDMIVYLLTVYKMQKLNLPKIYSYCCDGKDSEAVCEKYSIKEFPTSIIFTSDGKAQTTLIGASWSLL